MIIETGISACDLCIYIMSIANCEVLKTSVCFSSLLFVNKVSSDVQEHERVKEKENVEWLREKTWVEIVT